MIEVEKVINHIETQHQLVEVLVDRIIPAPTYEQFAVEQIINIEKIVAT